MRRCTTLVAVAAIVACAAPGCGRPGMGTVEGGPPGHDAFAAHRDTIFIEPFFNPPYDSGYHFVQVDQAGDTLALYQRLILGQHPHMRVLGPLGGISPKSRMKFLGMHRIEIQNPGQDFSGAEDFCTSGGNGDIMNLSLGKAYETPDSIYWRQSWRFIKRLGHIDDTLDVVRTVGVKRGEPYFLVRYDFTLVNAEPESLRFLWHIQRQIKFGKQRSHHEVGVAPGYGLVTRRHAFDAADLHYLACMARVGNPLATGTDTLADGTSSYLSPELEADFGSGTPGFEAGFIMFNNRGDVYPEQIAWVDTAGHYVPSLHFDSTWVHVDTTDVLDGQGRFLIARSKPLVFRQGRTKTMEYAVGRAPVVVKPGSHRPTFTVPEVTWNDGSKVKQSEF